jgi:PKD repeat protein
MKMYSEREGDTVEAKLTAVTVVLGMTVLALLTGCTAINSPPTASFTAFPSSGATPLSVSFDASSSYDPDGCIVSYEWDFRDGHFGVGETSTHTFNTVGTYSVKLTVTDSEGARDPVTHSITVTAAPTIQYRVTAGQLLDDYDANEVAADMKYKGQLIAVTGYVQNITNSSTGEPGVWLAPSQVWVFFTVDCYFRIIHQPQVAQLREGQLITIVGVCHGEGFFSVKLKECYIE